MYSSLIAKRGGGDKFRRCAMKRGERYRMASQGKRVLVQHHQQDRAPVLPLCYTVLIKWCSTLTGNCLKMLEALSLPLYHTFKHNLKGKQNGTRRKQAIETTHVMHAHTRNETWHKQRPLRCFFERKDIKIIPKKIDSGVFCSQVYFVIFACHLNLARQMIFYSRAVFIIKSIFNKLVRQRWFAFFLRVKNRMWKGNEADRVLGIYWSTYLICIYIHYNTSFSQYSS